MKLSLKYPHNSFRLKFCMLEMKGPKFTFFFSFSIWIASSSIIYWKGYLFLNFISLLFSYSNIFPIYFLWILLNTLIIQTLIFPRVLHSFPCFKILGFLQIQLTNFLRFLLIYQIVYASWSLFLFYLCFLRS